MRIRSRLVGAVTVWAGMGLLVGTTLWGQTTSHHTDRLLALDAAVGVACWLASPLLMYWPVAGTVVFTVLAALFPVATPPASMGTLVVARRRRLPVAVAVAVGGVAAQAIQGAWRHNAGIGYRWWLALITLGYAALVGWGVSARTRAALIDSLRERARRAEDGQADRVAQARLAERRRIAREMHDVLAHRLSLLATYAGAVEYRPDASPEQLSRAAGIVREGAHQALQELREVIGLLREDGDDPGTRPQPGLADLPRLLDESRAAGAEVRLRDDVADPAGIPEATGRAGYRVVQEAVTNARRHAPGEPVTVALSGGPGDGLTIEVANPLSARPPLSDGAGTGLVGLTERVRLAGGRLDHGATEAGFRLVAWLPWPA
jgi:signal transduction histidine kinase